MADWGAALDAHRRPTWIPTVGPGAGAATGSRFGGAPWLPDGVPWPTCRHCHLPLALLLQLDTRDLPAHAPGAGPDLVQLFYCCNVDAECEALQDGWDPWSGVSVGQRVAAVGPGKLAHAEAPGAFAAQRITGWVATDDLPNWEEAADLGVGLSDAESDTLGESNYPRSGDKLGGWPYWVQGIEYPQCPRCATRMTLLFQIDGDDHVPWGFGDAGCGHLTQCPAHPDVLGFGWACC